MLKLLDLLQNESIIKSEPLALRYHLRYGLGRAIYSPVLKQRCYYVFKDQFKSCYSLVEWNLLIVKIATEEKVIRCPKCLGCQRESAIFIQAYLAH